jgi:hypothetical protein
MNDAEDKMRELAKDAAKAFAESYENAVKASTQHIYNNLFNANDLTDLTNN